MHCVRLDQPSLVESSITTYLKIELNRWKSERACRDVEIRESMKIDDILISASFYCILTGLFQNKKMKQLLQFMDLVAI